MAARGHKKPGYCEDLWQGFPMTVDVPWQDGEMPHWAGSKLFCKLKASFKALKGQAWQQGLGSTIGDMEFGGAVFLLRWRQRREWEDLGGLGGISC